MSKLLDLEREKYEQISGVLEDYGRRSPGEQVVPLFLEMAKAQPGWHTGSILDAGCCGGAGGVRLAEQGFRVVLADITDIALTDEAKRLPFHQISVTDPLVSLGFFDWVYCCDVLEHLDECFTMLAVANMLRVARRGLFLTVALRPDRYGVWIGDVLHQTVRPFTWWRDRLETVGRLVVGRDLCENAAFYLEPR